MAYFSASMPAPQPNQDDAAFWQACSERRLCFQACAACGAVRHPPLPVCPRCQSMETAWRETAGQGNIYTYTIIHHASHDAVKGKLPYVVAVVEFADVPGVRLVTNITGIEPSHVLIGMPVAMWWDEIGGGMSLPRFRPVTKSKAGS